MHYQVGHADLGEMPNKMAELSPAGCPLRELNDTGCPLRTEFWFRFPGKHTKSPTTGLALPWPGLQQASYWGQLNSKWNDRRQNFTGTDEPWAFKLLLAEWLHSHVDLIYIQEEKKTKTPTLQWNSKLLRETIRTNTVDSTGWVEWAPLAYRLGIKRKKNGETLASDPTPF